MAAGEDKKNILTTTTPADGRKMNKKDLSIAKHEFKKPLLKQRRRKVLKEEEYLAKLGAIIRRDFFPTISKLQAEYSYLEALEDGDSIRLRDAVNRLSNLGNEEAPAMGLDEFQARYVTEDTHDFEELVEALQSKKKARELKVYGRPALKGSGKLELLEADPVKRKLTNETRAVVARNTRIEKVLPVSIASSDPLSRMIAEYRADMAGGPSSVRSGISQMCGVGEYDFVETPVRPLTMSVPTTPHRSLQSSRRELLQKPAVKRLLKAHTPKRPSSVFDTPKRKEV